MNINVIEINIAKNTELNIEWSFKWYFEQN